MPERKVKRRHASDTGAVDELPSDEGEQVALGARLKESREYIGLLQEDVATALGIPRTSVHALEAGKRKVTGLELRRLARLYRRSVGWLLGEEDASLSEAEPLFRAAAALSESDREQVLRFAEFLAAAGKPGHRSAGWLDGRRVADPADRRGVRVHSIHDEADVRVPRLAWDEFVTALTTGIPFHVNDRAATRLAVAGDPSLAPEHTCRPGVIGSAYACAACWIARPGEPTDG